MTYERNFCLSNNQGYIIHLMPRYFKENFKKSTSYYIIKFHSVPEIKQIYLYYCLSKEKLEKFVISKMLPS